MNKNVNKFKFRKNILILGIILTFVFIIYFVNVELKNRSLVNSQYEGKIKSANLSVDYEINQVMKDIDKLGLNTINVPIVINVDDINSDIMSIDNNSKKKATKLIKKLNKKGISTILEAYPWIKNGELYETDWNPMNKKRFFYNWQNTVLNELIEDVANPLDVKVLNVGSNFVYLEEYQQNWDEVIDFVQSKFDGLVTYRTNWWYTKKGDLDSKLSYEQKLNNNFFDKLDFISIATYFELSDKPVNTVDELISALHSSTVNNRGQNIKEELYNLSKVHRKPIFFGELGFSNRENASSQPWNHVPSDIINDEEQSRCFEAYRRVFEKEDWINGFSVFCVGKIDEEKNFYPSKESIKIIKSWYK
ncbi:hydrolase [Clostridioides difficile]|nr:hydrolase [Clostridioides difficile]